MWDNLISPLVYKEVGNLTLHGSGMKGFEKGATRSWLVTHGRRHHETTLFFAFVVEQKQDLHGALRLMKSLTCQHLVKTNYSLHSGS